MRLISRLDGIEIQEDSCLVGSKFAIQFGDGPIILSPAMMSLVRTAESEEQLRHLLSNIQLKKMPRMFDPKRDQLEMFTQNHFQGVDHVAIQQEKARTQETGDSIESSGGFRHDGSNESGEPDRAD